MTSAFSWQNSASLCSASFCTPRPNLSVTPGISWLSTFAFQSPTMNRGSLVVQLVKNPSPMWGTWVQSLDWEDPLEKGKATRFGILVWRIPWTVGRKELNMTEWLSPFFMMKRTSFFGISSRHKRWLYTWTSQDCQYQN